MTRFLSEALDAKEPYFRQGLLKLERANQNPSHDIRLSHAVMSKTKAKVLELGLDPIDSTAEEIYEALKQRLKTDDQRLTNKLRTLAASKVSLEADPVDGMIEALKQASNNRSCFGLKTSRLKSILSNQPPKKAMKQLGYRSVISMLKHEQPVLIMAAAWISESSAWKKRLLDEYKKLIPNDFENKNITLVRPRSTKWKKLGSQIVETSKHNVLCFKELGALVFLPLPKDPPPGALTASLSLSLHQVNEIRAASTFLRLNQVRQDFGVIVKQVALEEPQLNSLLLDQPIPWNLVHSYYAKSQNRFREDIFEPYIRLEDLIWESIEKALSKIEPSLKFWQGTAALGLVNKHKPVSLNIIDSALNLCNLRPFEKRVVHFLQKSLWHELLIGYLRHKPVEDSVLAELQPEPVYEAA